MDAEDPPLRVFFGTAGLPMTKAEYARRIETWEQWNDLSNEAQGDLAAKQGGAAAASVPIVKSPKPG